MKHKEMLEKLEQVKKLLIQHGAYTFICSMEKPILEQHVQDRF